MTRPGGTWQNWARTERVRPRRVEYPASVEAVQRAVVAAAQRGLRVRAAGAGHSFNGVAAAPDVQLVLDDLAGIVAVDRERRRVRLLAGTRLHRIPALLAPHGLGLILGGDSDRQTLAGAVSTGMHGTGLGVGSLSTRVVAVTLVTADGDLLEIGEEDPRLLAAAALSLGAFGILVDVTIACVSAFAADEAVDREPLAAVTGSLLGRLSAAAHVEVSWYPHTDAALVTTRTVRPGAASTLDGVRAPRRIRDDIVDNGMRRLASVASLLAPPLIPSLSRAAVASQGGRRFSDASGRLAPAPHRVRFQQLEYAIPLDVLPHAFAAVREVAASSRSRIPAPVTIRTSAADELPLSPAFGRASAYLAVRRYRGAEGPPHFFAAVEEVLLGYGGRPHWATMHTQDAVALAPRYPRFADVVALRDRLDPGRRFTNAYLERVLGG